MLLLLITYLLVFKALILIERSFYRTFDKMLQYVLGNKSEVRSNDLNYATTKQYEN